MTGYDNQKILLGEGYKQIKRLLSQLSEYEKELYEKDVHIEKLESELRQISGASLKTGIQL
jgi:dsDNA-specific endonuclease/ATPase MutS2